MGGAALTPRIANAPSASLGDLAPGGGRRAVATASTSSASAPISSTTNVAHCAGCSWVQLFEMLSYLINFLAGAIEIYASQAGA